MNLAVFALAASLLSLERVGYLWAWRRPEAFARRVRALGLADDPVIGLERLFYGFKVLQIGVLTGWIAWRQGDAFPALAPEPWAFWGGLALVVVGQALNFGTFRAIGRTGVFYGVRFGHDVPWCSKFPFNLVDHPQYVGTVMTIWGAFLASDLPEPDWVVLPAFLTVSYLIGMALEKPIEGEARSATSDASAGGVSKSAAVRPAATPRPPAAPTPSRERRQRVGSRRG